MTFRTRITTSISRLSVSLMLMLLAMPAAHAQKLFRMEKDSIPLFRGFALSFDLVGPAMKIWGDHGEYEGALRINLHDQWFPVVELGIGTANHDQDEVTLITYKTTAPYGRIGMDWNVLRNKHQANRMYAGFRYAFTSYKVDIIRENLPDPVWISMSGFGVKDMSCYQHWAEIVFGVDAKIFGPFHLGWAVRYKRRLFYDAGDIGNTWYVPGFGTGQRDQISANFNAIIDI